MTEHQVSPTAIAWWAKNELDAYGQWRLAAELLAIKAPSSPELASMQAQVLTAQYPGTNPSADDLELMTVPVNYLSLPTPANTYSHYDLAGVGLLVLVAVISLFFMPRHNPRIRNMCGWVLLPSAFSFIISLCALAFIHDPFLPSAVIIVTLSLYFGYKVNFGDSGFPYDTENETTYQVIDQRDG